MAALIEVTLPVNASRKIERMKIEDSASTSRVFIDKKKIGESREKT